MIIGNKSFESGTHVMAIINLTPDSFFETSRVKSELEILDRAERAMLDGAEIIDLGAQSTRPGHTVVSAQEEIRRFGNIVSTLKEHFPDMLISIDTYYSEVAKHTLDQGADLINDIWGLQYDNGEMADVIAKYNAACCLMHNSSTGVYNDYWGDIISFLNKSLEIAKKAKIDPNKICLDGGVGFGKNIDECWEMLNNYDKLNVFGYPLLLGTSRKRMFGGEIKDRLKPTLDSTLIACQKNVLFVRVHDVKENKEIIDNYYANNNRN